MKKKTIIILAIYAIILIIIGIVFLSFYKYKHTMKEFGEVINDSEKLEAFIDKNFDKKAVYALSKLSDSIDSNTSTEEFEKKFKELYKNAKKEDYEEVFEQFKSEAVLLYSRSYTMKYKGNDKAEKNKDFPFLKSYKVAYINNKTSDEDAVYFLYYKNKLVYIDFSLLSFMGF